MKIWYAVNQQFHRPEYKGQKIVKNDYIRFGKIIYKVKYISTTPSESAANPVKPPPPTTVENSRRAKLNQVTPLTPKPSLSQNFAEEHKMLQDSLANNSALAATIDQFEGSRMETPNLISHVRSNSRAQKLQNTPLEESKDDEHDDFEQKDYACNDLDMSINYELPANLDEKEPDFEIISADCRICLQEGKVIGENHEDYDTLLAANPCKCTGYVHITCLREWLKVHRKTFFENNVCTSYIWDKIRCEICLHSYPDYIF